MKALIADSSVLIDYVTTDVSVLSSASRCLAPMYVSNVVLEEVEQLSADDCSSLGLTLSEPSEEQLFLAGELSVSGGLSFEDWTCVILARDNDWICLTNDAGMHKACEEWTVSAMWGLALMIELVQVGELEAEEAVEIAENIHRSNRRIKREVVDRFTAKVTRHSRKH